MMRILYWKGVSTYNTVFFFTSQFRLTFSVMTCQGGLNKFHGQHALRERAKKIGEGILVIRFEMPYNIWCGGCSSMIAQGVRFNAEKKQVGNYYSTKVQ